jgi:type II secretory pathway pseudopilin PulG
MEWNEKMNTKKNTSKSSVLTLLWRRLGLPISDLRSPSSSSRGGFTLIELLAVIGIIMLLAVLILVGFSGMRNRARDLKAKRNIAQLKTAWDAYYADYSGFPALSITDSGIACIQILRGKPHGDDSPTVVGYRAMNRKDIRYMDFHHKATEFNDPWGHRYRVALDADYDGQVSVPVSAGVPSGMLHMSVAAWSAGRDGTDGTDDDIKTWR